MCCDIYLSRLFWCELPSFETTGFGDVCLLLNAMERDGRVACTAKYILKIQQQGLFPLIQDDPQSCHWENIFFPTELHLNNGQNEGSIVMTPSTAKF